MSGLQPRRNVSRREILTAMAVVLGCSACGETGKEVGNAPVPGVTPQHIALAEESPATRASLYGDHEAISTVLMLIEPGTASAQHISEAVSALCGAGHAVVTAEGRNAWTPDTAARFFVTMFPGEEPAAVQGIVAFGSAQSWAWDTIALLGEQLDWAFLTSCPLPDSAPNFARLRGTPVEIAYAESGQAYASSYLKAHHAMRAIPTPHEFLIYGGGVQDSFYDHSSAEYHEPTWRAVRDAIVEWAHRYSG